MSEQAEHVLEQAMKLDMTERAVLAAELAASLEADEQGDQANEGAWLAEIERRVRRAQAGESTGSDWESVQARIEERLRSGRA